MNIEKETDIDLIDKELKPIIQKIHKAIKDKKPSILWVHQSAGIKIKIGSDFCHIEEFGSFSPEEQIILDLDKERTTRLSELLNIGKANYLYKERDRAYIREHWWAETNILGATWHYETWEDECIGADFSFIVVNPDSNITAK